MVDINDRCFVSPAGFWTVWKLKSGYGIYNDSGAKIVTISGHHARYLEMAKVIATAFDAKWQR